MVVHRCQAACDFSRNWAAAGRERAVEMLADKRAGHPCCVCVCGGQGLGEGGPKRCTTVVVSVNGLKWATAPARTVSLWVTEDSTPLALALSLLPSSHAFRCVSLQLCAVPTSPLPCPLSFLVPFSRVMCTGGSQRSRHEVAQHSRESGDCQEKGIRGHRVPLSRELLSD